MAGKPHNGWSSFTAWQVALYLNNHSEELQADCQKVMRDYDEEKLTHEQALLQLEKVVMRHFHQMRTPNGYNISRRSLKEWFISQQ